MPGEQTRAFGRYEFAGLGRVSRVVRDGRAGAVESRELYITLLAANGGRAAGHAVGERQNGHRQPARGDHWGEWIWAAH